MAQKKLFVAVPFTEKDEIEDVLREQHQAAMDLETQMGETYDVIDYIDASMFMIHPLKTLAKALTALADADLAIFLPGWEASKICKVLRLCADGYRIRVLNLVM